MNEKKDLEAIIEKLFKVADNLTDAVDGMRKSSNRDGADNNLSFFRDELKTVRNSIRVLAKVLHEGNGQLPLIARVAVLESQATENSKDNNNLQLDIRELTAGNEKHHRELSQKIKELSSRVESISGAVKGLEKAEQERQEERTISRKGRYTIIAAVVSGVAGLLTSVASLIFGG